MVSIAHYVGLAGLVEIDYRYLLCANIFLCNTQCFFHTKLNRQSVGIPSRFTPDHITTLRLIAAYNILDCPRHHMMYPGYAVCRRRALIKDKFTFAINLTYTFMKGVILIPGFQDLLVHS